jgi:hypothetical protein
MDDFKTIYIILKVLRDAMDTGLDPKDISAEALGISEKRRDSLLIMMQKSGYIDGLKEFHAIGMQGIRCEDVSITIKGLEYLEENSMMKKAYRTLKGIKDIIPGA